VSTLRAPPQTPGGGSGRASSLSPQTTPTSTGFPPNYPQSQHLTPAYFDGNGQPVAVTKMSTVGTASATESHVGEGEGGGSRTTAGERDDRDEDMFSTDTNYREAGSVASIGADHDAMDEDMDGLAHAHDDDRMSDDGSASLVGFGEGAGSTVSGPIYHRRPVPGSIAANYQASLDRTNSGMSEGGARRDRDTPMAGEDNTTSALRERRDAQMMDGIAADQMRPGYGPDADGFIDTTVRGPVPDTAPQSRQIAENIVQQLDHGEISAGQTALGSPGRGGETLGKFYFEGERRE
jgi:hypothetical protein